MKIFSLSFKNVFENRWRTLTLGSFIFIVSLILIIFGSFTDTIKSNMENALSSSLTGDIQIRNGASTEEDMFTMKGTWGDITYLEADQLSEIREVLNGQESVVASTELVRHTVMLSKDDIKEPTLLVGLEPQSTDAYTRFFELTEGEYLSESAQGEIVLSKPQAKKLEVKIGDEINIQALTKDGQPVQVPVKVVGIGAIELLTTFSFFPSYVDLPTAQEAIGFQSGEATDMVVFTEDRQVAEQDMMTLQSALEETSLSSEAVKLSTWKEMGGFVMSNIEVYVTMFYACIAVLLVIIAILIINIVFMMGMERRQEIGTMRAIGFNRSHIIQIFLGEILFITAIFFTLGALCGLLINYTFSKVGLNVFSPLSNITGKQLYLLFDVAHVVPALIVVFSIALLSAFYPSLKSASLNPTEALKEV